MLTPFHKLKGFEKRVELPGPSHRQNDPSEQAEEAIEASRIARVAQSMQQIAQSRPTTKLLDPESLPRLDAPTAPFQRLGRPLKRPVPPSSEGQERKRQRNKTKRPLPDKKWRKANSRKESLLETDGMPNLVYSFLDCRFCYYSVSVICMHISNDVIFLVVFLLYKSSGQLIAPCPGNLFLLFIGNPKPPPGREKNF